MPKSQCLNFVKASHQISGRSRLLAGLIFLVCLASAGVLHWAAVNDKINMELLVGPCGFKQRYGLPCPSCGMTTAMIAFAKGDVLSAFYIQPAAAVFCSAVVLVVMFAFVMAVFGTDFGLIGYLSEQLKVKHIIFTAIVIMCGAWAVTLARALAGRIP
jgi:hypothetical protein